MAHFISLEEAARSLGISPEDLKQMAQNREIRAFQDGGSWQFRQSDIDDEARRRGMGSDPDLSLSDLDLEVPEGSGSQDIDLSEFQLGVATPDVAATSEPGVQSTSDPDIKVDDLGLPPELSGSSSTIIGMKPAGKLPSDSDVKLMPEDVSRTAGDSDVRIATPPPARPSDSDVTLVSDDSSHELPTHTPTGGDDPNATTLARSPLLGSSDEIEAVPEEDSDFELTPSSVIDALQPDSGSDFELTALEASDEFDATPAPAKRSPSDSDVTGVEPSASGVNLGKPSDSGINLVTGAFDFSSADSIELAPLDEDDDARPAPKPKPAAKAPPLAPENDPGATALPIKAGGEKDIFEDTDFEVDALEAGDDRTMQLEATSDFDIDEGDSASEVFAIDEDDVDQNAATAMASAPEIDDDLFGDGGGASSEGDAWGDVSGEGSLSSAAVADSPSAAVAAAPVGAAASPARGASALLTNAQGPEWGTPWVVLLGLTAVFMLLLAFVGLDLVSNLYEFRGDGPSFGLVKAIAGLMGGGAS